MKRKDGSVATVTQRVKAVKQPRGGYLNPKSMEIRQLDGDEVLDAKIENVSPSLVGGAVDYLARFANGAPLEEAFEVSLRGALVLGMEGEASVMLQRVVGVDAVSITNACQLAGFDVAYRVGPHRYRPVEYIVPDEITISHIAVMVKRAKSFFDEYGPVVLSGFTFAGAFTDLVTNGDGDFLTRDTLWDFKVSINGPTKNHTLQLLMYWLMGLESGNPHFQAIQRVGIFNPRQNVAYLAGVDQVSSKVVDEIRRDVIGYRD